MAENLIKFDFSGSIITFTAPLIELTPKTRVAEPCKTSIRRTLSKSIGKFKLK